MNKKIVYVAALVVIAGLSGILYWSSKKTDSTVAENTQAKSTVAGATSDNSDTPYFSQDAKVMLFYSEYCSWCIKEKEVLKDLAKDGYKVKPMDVGKNQSLWTDYQINGTPTLIAPDGTRAVGYQDKEKLKAFLDKYK
jgi:protein-disulfide isomerase